MTKVSVTVLPLEFEGRVENIVTLEGKCFKELETIINQTERSIRVLLTFAISPVLDNCGIFF